MQNIMLWMSHSNACSAIFLAVSSNFPIFLNLPVWNMTERGTKVPTNDAKKLLEIVWERDRLLSEQEATINCLKSAFDKEKKEIRDLEKKNKELDWEFENFPSLEPLKYIQKSIATVTEINYTSILHYQTFEKYVKERLEQKDTEIEKTKEECKKNDLDALEKLKNKPEYQELESLKTEWLKLDIERRKREVEIQNDKKIYELKKAIVDRLYYNEFVELAENYLTIQESEKLRELKKKEMAEIQKLYELQEKAKLKQHMGHSQKLSKLSEITLGNGQIPYKRRIEKPPVKVEKKVTVPVVKAFQDLSTLFAEPFSQPSPVLSTLPPLKETQPPVKLRILEQKILAPNFTKPHSAPPAQQEKRKKPVVIDVASQYRKISQKLENKLNSSMTRLSQQSEPGGTQVAENLSQRSQSSQPISQRSEKMSQSSQMSQNRSQMNQNRSQDSDKMNQTIMAQQDVEVLPSQTQLTTILIEDTQMTDTQEEIEVMEGEDEISLPATVKLQSIMKNSYQKNPQHFYSRTNQNFPPALQEQAETSPFLKPSVPPITTFSESQKSVRFNLEDEADKQEKEGNMKGMFGSGGFGFGISNFSPFFGGNMSSTTEATSEGSSVNNTMLNMAETDTSRMIGERVDVTSPNFSYEENKEETQMKSFMSGFGEGGFSFGKDMFTL